jgi:hypothetical protein
VSRDHPSRELGHRRLEEEVIRLHEWRGGESSVLWGLADVISGYRHSRTVWGHRSRQADRWHIASRELVSRRAENLVSRVARREDTRKRRNGERIGAIHLIRTGGRDQGDLANSGVRRVKAQVLGIQSREARGREAAKERERSRAVHLRGQVAEIERSHELGSSQSESPSIGCSKSRGARTRSGEGARGSGPSIEEDACQRSRDLANSEVRRVKAQALGTPSHEDARREKEDNRWIRIAGGPLDPHVGSCIGTSREKTRGFGREDRDIARSEIPTVGGQVAITKRRVEYRWHEDLGISPREVPKYWC